MIKTVYTKTKELIEFESSGHATHDVCVATSAICSTIIQFIIQKEAEGKICILQQIYENGHTYAKFKLKKNFKEVISGIEALLTGLEMFAKNYPNEINFEIFYK